MRRLMVLTTDEALDFGRLVEDALTKVGASEITALKVKLISLVAEQDRWVDMFVNAGLPADAATLISLMLKMERAGAM